MSEEELKYNDNNNDEEELKKKSQSMSWGDRGTDNDNPSNASYVLSELPLT